MSTKAVMFFTFYQHVTDKTCKPLHKPFIDQTNSCQKYSASSKCRYAIAITSKHSRKHRKVREEMTVGLKETAQVVQMGLAASGGPPGDGGAAKGPNNTGGDLGDGFCYKITEKQRSSTRYGQNSSSE